MRQIFVVSFLLSALSGPASAGESFSAKVVRVVDGDTITVLRGRKRLTLRVRGVDCPELAQPFGPRAKKLTLGMIGGKTVSVALVKKGVAELTIRRVHEIEVMRGGKVSLRKVISAVSMGAELLKKGLAWHDKGHGKSARLAALEAEARAARRGLWSRANPVPPWRWRARKKHGSK